VQHEAADEGRVVGASLLDEPRDVLGIDPKTNASFEAIRNLFVEMLAGDYQLVAHVHVRET
jgi:hypothetical protein